MKLKKVMAGLLSAALLTASFAACSSSSGYSDYEAAYNKVTANGGLDASINYSVTMDGTTTSGTGSLKMDTTANTMLFVMNMNNGSTITEFTDGTYLYVDNGTTKKKTAINESDSGSGDTSKVAGNGEERDDSNGSPEFDVSSFVSQFASYMEVNKIKEMGLLNALPSNIVSKTTYKDGVYTLDADSSAISKILVSTETGDGNSEVPEVSDLKNFTYQATASDGIITAVKMTGNIDVKVPGSLMTDGNEASYTMDLTIDITFNNPGQAVTVELPSTDGYTE